MGCGGRGKGMGGSGGCSESFSCLTQLRLSFCEAGVVTIGKTDEKSGGGGTTFEGRNKTQNKLCNSRTALIKNLGPVVAAIMDIVKTPT